MLKLGLGRLARIALTAEGRQKLEGFSVEDALRQAEGPSSVETHWPARETTPGGWAGQIARMTEELAYLRRGLVVGHAVLDDADLEAFLPESHRRGAVVAEEEVLGDGFEEGARRFQPGDADAVLGRLPIRRRRPPPRPRSARGVA